MRKILLDYLLPGIGAPLLAWFGIMAMQSGFDSLQSMRQLERIAPTVIAATLPGEVSINATARQDERLVKSRYTHTPSIYYRFTHEVEERDSDGDTHWRTVQDISDAVDFFLEDATGKIRVSVKNNLQQPIQWSMPSSFRVTQGRDRYTEWRLEPGQNVFVFANAVEDAEGVHLSFVWPGEYTPIISRYGEASERADMGVSTVLMLWLGLGLIAMATYAAALLLKIHRLLVYLGALTLILALTLVNMGMSMMKQDLVHGVHRYQHQVKESRKAIDDILYAHQLEWKGWDQLGDFDHYDRYGMSYNEREKLKQIRINLALAQRKLSRQMQATPERWFLGAWGLRVQPMVAGLTPEDRYTVDQRLQAFTPTRLDPLWSWIIAGIGIVLLLVFMFVGIRRVKTKRLIENVPTSKTSGVVFGMAEVKGNLVLAEGVEHLVSPLSSSFCGWYHYIVKEKRGSGKNATWVTIQDDEMSVDFGCKDADGFLPIVTDGAEVITEHVVKKSSGRLHYTELSLRMGDPLYALGSVNVDSVSGDRLVLGQGSNSDPYILSNLPEKRVMLRKARAGMLYLNLAFIATLLAAMFLFGMNGGFAATDFLLAALIAPLFMIMVTVILHYNDIIFLKQRVERNRSNIKVSLQKQHELIPNIEKIARQYMQYEEQLLTSLTALRSSYQNALASSSRLGDYLQDQHRTLAQFKMLREQYPDLKASELMQQVTATLIKLENELTFMREGYNDAVQVYNTRIRTVPDILFTLMFKFREYPLISK